jgi:hypothetical protein
LHHFARLVKTLIGFKELAFTATCSGDCLLARHSYQAAHLKGRSALFQATILVCFLLASSGSMHAFIKSVIDKP